jgi:hypothetical protein
VVRIVFFALLFANLAYFAWAQWIDVPEAPPPSDISKLPRLKLAEEVDPAGHAEPGTPERTALKDPPGCLSVGPFPDSDAGARALTLLRGKGFDPRQRAEEGPPVEGYWVYVGGLKSETDADKALVTLEHGGIKDAVPMPENADAGRRLSLGMFSERTRAEKRAQAVQEQTGLKVEIAERKLPGTVYWVDFPAPSGTGAVPLQDLFAEASSSRIALQPCPAAPAASAPASAPPTGTATAHPSPHGAATAAATSVASAPTQLR